MPLNPSDCSFTTFSVCEGSCVACSPSHQCWVHPAVCVYWRGRYHCRQISHQGDVYWFLYKKEFSFQLALTLGSGSDICCFALSFVPMVNVKAERAQAPVHLQSNSTRRCSLVAFCCLAIIISKAAAEIAFRYEKPMSTHHASEASSLYLLGFVYQLLLWPLAFLSAPSIGKENKMRKTIKKTSSIVSCTVATTFTK